MLALLSKVLHTIRINLLKEDDACIVEFQPGKTVIFLPKIADKSDRGIILKKVVPDKEDFGFIDVVDLSQFH